MREELLNLTGVDAGVCFQCRKCSLGCPISFLMETKVSELIRLIQLGDREGVLNADTFWYCVSCETCSTRCPQDVNIPRLMDGLRQIYFKEKGTPTLEEIPLFFRKFLDSVLKRGRIFELGVVMSYNMSRAQFFKDIDLLPLLLSRGKISFLPPGKVSLTDKVREIYKKTSERE